MELLGPRGSSLEQVQDDRDRDQANESVAAQLANQGRDVAHHVPADEGHRSAKQDLQDHRQRDQKQAEFRDFTEPQTHSLNHRIHPPVIDCAEINTSRR